MHSVLFNQSEHYLKQKSSYLANRYQKVKYESAVLSPSQTIHDVPHGAVLGPILFFVCTNDLAKVIEDCKVKLLVDSTMVYISNTSNSDIVDKLKELNFQCMSIMFD